MNYFGGFDAIKNDPEGFSKLAMLAVAYLLIACIPIVGGFLAAFLLNGFIAVYMQRRIRGEHGVPRFDFDFDYLQELGKLGIPAFLTSLAFSLGLMGVMILCWIVGAIGGAIGNAVDVPAISIIFVVLAGLLMFALMIPASILMRCAMIRAHLSSDISTGLDFRAALRMFKATWVPMLIASFVVAAIAMVAMLAGMLMCGIGIYFTFMIVSVMSADIDTQIYQDYVGQGGEAVEVHNFALGNPPNMGVTQPNPNTF